jgi:MFS family permease
MRDKRLLLALSALIITGGSLGDLYGRRIVFVSGLVGFAITSLLCGLAPSGEVLIAARILQGVAAALLVPASLAIVEASSRLAAVGGERVRVGVAGAVVADLAEQSGGGHDAFRDGSRSA